MFRPVLCLAFPPNTNRDQCADILSNHDVFIWGGATGLSDYPDVPLELVEFAFAKELTNVNALSFGSATQLYPSLPGGPGRLSVETRRFLPG